MSRRKAVSLIEMIVVIVILLVLAGITLPLIASAKGKGLQTSCIGNLRQVYTAYSLYREDSAISLPPTSLASVLQYANSDQIFVCPAEHSIMPRKNGQYGAVLLDPAESMDTSATRISYAYLWDYMAEKDVKGVPSFERALGLPNVGLLSCPWHGPISSEAVRSPALKHMVGRSGPFLRIASDGHLFIWAKAWSPQNMSTGDLFYFPTTYKQVAGF